MRAAPAWQIPLFATLLEMIDTITPIFCESRICLFTSSFPASVFSNTNTSFKTWALCSESDNKSKRQSRPPFSATLWQYSFLTVRLLKHDKYRAGFLLPFIDVRSLT